MNKIISIILSISFILSCSERDRTNIFDPQAGIDTLDLSIYISRADEIVKLDWFNPSNIDYDGVNVYRKSETEENYTNIANLPSDQPSYSDTDTEFDNTYSYYLTLQGKNNESSPTRNISVTPGPLSFWILDRYGLNMYRATYDLRYSRLTKYAVWIPEDLSVDPVHNRVLVTYPQYRFAEIFEQNEGKTEINFSQFSHPFGCIFEPDRSQFWLTDSSGYLYTIDPISGITELLDQSLSRPTQITNSDPGIYVIDSGDEKILMYNKSGSQINSLKTIGSITLNQPLFIETVILNGNLFIIDQKAETRVLYKFDRIENELTEIYTDAFMRTVRFDAKTNSVWLSIDNQLNSAIMQLSMDGVRLKMLSGFSGIADFRYNPETETLVVVDSGEGVVKHLHPDATVIGVFDKAVYPSKVYTE